MQGDDTSTLRGRVSAYQYWIPMAVLALGVVSTGILIWTSLIIDRQEVNFEHTDVIMDIRVVTTTFHLWFEEAIAGGTRDGIRRTFPDLDAAVKLSDTLLHGGESEQGTPVPPLDDPLYRRQVEKIGTLLADYREIALKRYADPAAGGIGSALDNQCNAVFRELQETLRGLENLAEQTQANDHTKTQRLLTIAILLWTSLATAATGLLYNLERRRKRAELALERAYEEMEKRVLDRTSDLAEVNRQLEKEIADRRWAETSLFEREEGFRKLSVQFQTLLDTIPDSISLVSPDLKVRWANRSADVNPCVAGEAPTKGHCYRLQHNGTAPCDGCPAMRSFATGKAENALITTSDGRHWDTRTVPIAREDGTIESVLEVATDVTEKVALQAETIRTAHLASVGELAAGVAHEINNPINGIINYARILSDKSDGESQEHDLANRILKEGRRIADIVRGLLLFARGGKKEKTPVHIREIVSDSLGLTGSQLRKEGIEIRSVVPDELPEIIADPQELQQVFMNIISNARYALNQKYPGRHDEKSLQIHAELVATTGNGHCVRITFHDRGVGIPGSIIDKIREPFFSTKPTGKGTGLGLSISDGIISEHGGNLSIESVEGESTTVVIELPAREKGNGQNPRH
jgi:two-component system, NtrC family, sensor kinase